MVVFELEMRFKTAVIDDGITHVITKPEDEVPPDVIGKEYEHAFEDGFVAHVHVREVNDQEASELSQKSEGFGIHEWMVTSIINNHDIVLSDRPY